MSFDGINVLLAVTACLNLVLGLIILFFGPKRKINIVYGLNIITIIGWIAGMFFYRSSSPESNMFWCTILYVAATLIASSFLYFTYIFPSQKEHNIFYQMLFIISVNAAIIIMIIWPNLIIQSVTVRPGMEKAISFSKFYWFYFIYILSFFSYGFIRLFKKYRNCTGIKRSQIQYLLTGYALSANLAFATNLIMPWIGYFFLNWLGQILTIIMVSFTAYAIVRHQLLDIKIIIQKSIVYAILVGAIISLYLLIISVIPIWFTISNTSLHPLASLLSAFLGALGVPPLRKFLQRKTDKIFFKDHVPYADAVHRLGSVMNLNLDLNSLVNGTLNELCDIFKPKEIKIYLIREKKLFTRDCGPDITVTQEENFDLLPMNDDSLFINAEYDGVNSAQILIGEKRSGDAYLPEDRQIMTTFSYQFAMALQKTLLYEQLKQKNIELKNRLTAKSKL